MRVPFCKKCGEEVPAEADFCPECGARIGKIRQKGVAPRVKRSGTLTAAGILAFFAAFGMLLWGVSGIATAVFELEEIRSVWGMVGIMGFLGFVFGFLAGTLTLKRTMCFLAIISLVFTIAFSVIIPLLLPLLAGIRVGIENILLTTIPALAALVSVAVSRREFTC